MFQQVILVIAVTTEIFMFVIHIAMMTTGMVTVVMTTATTAHSIIAIKLKSRGSFGSLFFCYLLSMVFRISVEESVS